MRVGTGEKKTGRTEGARGIFTKFAKHEKGDQKKINWETDGGKKERASSKWWEDCKGGVWGR